MSTASLGLLAAGCTAFDGSQKRSELDAARQQLNIMLREARAESSAIREEMAKTRIAAAKQEAELQELRRQVAELRQTLEGKQVEIKTLRSERDRLLQVKTEQETQLVELARLRQAATEAAASQAKLRELETVLASTTAELEQARKRLGQRQAKGAGKPTSQPAKAKKAGPEEAPPNPTATSQPKTAGLAPARPPGSPESRPPGEPTMRVADVRTAPEGVTRVTVQPGDTLWSIAHQHGLTVEALKGANGLEHDVIVTGQELLIPANPADR
ncbi:LysM peptidoglycan-binding domain-containing protein [Nitrospira sp. Kam-Ns4a]